MLSIIVLSFNQRTVTMRLLESMEGWLRGHSDEGEQGSELVLVDNGSADGTAGCVRDWAAGRHLGNVRVVETGVNLGVARGRNRGLSEARGDVLMLLDNDTLACQETFDALWRHVDATPSCGVAAPALHSPQGELQASAKPYPSPWLKLAHVLRPGKELECERRELGKAHPYYVIGACQVLRRDVLQRVGLLDGKIFYGPEDADFCRRVRRAGYTVDYLPGLRLVHDWRRATRRSPLSRLGLLHARALMRFWRRTLFCR